MKAPLNRPRMTGLCRALLLAVFTVAVAGTALAEEAADRQPAPRWLVTAECRMIVVTESRMLALLPELLDEARIDAATRKLETLIAKGEARLAASLLLRTEDGTRGVAESVKEFPYPTEFDPPAVPNELPKENPLAVLKAWPVVAITPTTFERRNIGATLELEPVIRAHGARIYVDAVPQHVRFLRWEKFEAGVLVSGKKLGLEQPQFFTTKTTFSMEFRNGETVLVGVHKLIEPQGSFELVFLQVSARRQQDAK